MSTAEATTFADNIKALGDSLVNMKVLEVLQLTKYLKEAYGLEAAAAAPVDDGRPPAAAAGRGRRRRRPSSTWCSRRSAPTRSTSSRWCARPRPGPQGGQGPGRGRPQGDQDGHLQGRRREAQEGARGRRRHRQDQVIGQPAVDHRSAGRHRRRLSARARPSTPATRQHASRFAQPRSPAASRVARLRGVSARSGRRRPGDRGRPAPLHPHSPSGARAHAHLDLGASNHPRQETELRPDLRRVLRSPT